MEKSIIVVLILVSFGLLNSCNKDDDPIPPTPTNVLCDGNGTTSYLPITLGNVWKYSGQHSFTMTVSKTITVNSQTYYEVKFDDQLTDWEYYYRVAANGDIYELINDVEYLYLPANPSIGQSWDYPCGFDGMGKRRVDNFPFALETDHCNYEEFIFVRDIDGTGDYLTSYTYVQGIGMTTYTIFSTSELAEISLK